jgi:hypothetical protein
VAKSAKELQLSRRLCEAQDKLRAQAIELDDVLSQLQKANSRVEKYMNKNGALWLEMSKLPGGLEAARKHIG